MSYPQVTFRTTPTMGIPIATVHVGKMEAYEASGDTPQEALLNAVNHWINMTNKRKLKNEND